MGLGENSIMGSYNRNASEVKQVESFSTESTEDQDCSIDVYENIAIEVYRIANVEILTTKDIQEYGERDVEREGSSEDTLSMKQIEWEKLGIYDDDDLEDDNILFVYANNAKFIHHSYLWVGKEYYFTPTAMNSPPLNKEHLETSSPFRHLNLKFNLSKVVASFRDAVAAGINLGDFQNIVRSGEETDRFWLLYEAGY